MTETNQGVANIYLPLIPRAMPTEPSIPTPGPSSARIHRRRSSLMPVVAYLCIVMLPICSGEEFIKPKPLKYYINTGGDLLEQLYIVAEYFFLYN